LRADSYVFQTATPVEGRLMAIQSLYTTFVGLNLIFYAKDHSIGRGILKKMILIPEDMLPISFGTLQTLEAPLRICYLYLLAPYKQKKSRELDSRFDS